MWTETEGLIETAQRRLRNRELYTRVVEVNDLDRDDLYEVPEGFLYDRSVESICLVPSVSRMTELDFKQEYLSEVAGK